MEKTRLSGSFSNQNQHPCPFRFATAFIPLLCGARFSSMAMASVAASDRGISLLTVEIPALQKTSKSLEMFTKF
jgi:hypothetical protein